MIYLWKVKQDGKLELSKSFPAHGSWVWSVALNSEGQLLASGGQDGIVKIWSITTDLSINSVTLCPTLLKNIMLLLEPLLLVLIVSF
jgi:WD40 repeat protein